MSIRLADLIIEAALQDANVKRGLDQLERRTKQSSSRLKGLLATGLKAGIAVGAAAIVAGTATIVKSLGSATDAFETMNLVAASLGPATEKFNQSISEIAANTRRSRFELLEGASSIIAMSRNMGFAQDNAGEFSAAMTKAAVGLGSFFNVADTNVLRDLQSAIAGSSETVQKYGLDVREQTLRQEALNQGLIESASDVLPRNIRAQLIFQQVVAQAGDALGTTGAEINSYEDALRALQGATTDAERTSRSAANAMRGIQASIRDTSTGIGMVFLPIWTRMLNVVADFAQDVGPRIVDAAERMVRGWLQRLGSMEAGTARSLGRTLGFMVSFGKQVVKWGANIVAALAQGIMGAISLVVSAIKLIGRVIASLLSPGSPPKFLPDLDKWGTEAANVYLEGWTKADFGILNEVGRQVEGILRGQGAEGEGLIGRVAGTRQAVAEVIQRFRQTGQVGVEAYDRIREAAGGAADAAVGLIKRQFELAKASQRVKEINEALSAVEEQRQRIQERRQLADIQARLAEGGLSAEERQLALLEAQEIGLRRRLRTAEDEQGERKTELDIFKERLGVQQESLDLTQSLADAMAGAAGAAGKIKDGVAGLGDSLRNEIEGAIPDLGELGLVPSFEAEFANISELIDTQFKPGFEEGQRIADEFATNVEDSINRLLTSLGLIQGEDPLAFLGGESTDAVAQQQGVFDRIGKAIGGFGDKLSGLAEAIDKLDTKKVEQLADALVAIGTAFVTYQIIVKIIGFVSALGKVAAIITGAEGVTAALGSIVAILGGPLTLAVLGIVATVGALALAWRRDWGGIQEKTEEVWDDLKLIFDAIKKVFNEDFPEMFRTAKQEWDTFWDNFKTVTLPSWLDTLGDKLEGLKDSFRKLGETATEYGILGASPSGLEISLEAISDQFDDVESRVKRVARAMRDRALRSLQSGQQRAQTPLSAAWRDLGRELGDTTDTGKDFLDFWVDDLQPVLEDTEDFLRFDLVRAFSGLANRLRSVLQPALAETERRLAEFLAPGGLIDQVRQRLGGVGLFAQGVMDDVQARLERALETAQALIDAISRANELSTQLPGQPAVAGASVLSAPRPRLNLSGGRTTIINEGDTVTIEMIINNEMDLELAARRIARIFQDRR